MTKNCFNYKNKLLKENNKVILMDFFITIKTCEQMV